MKRIIALLALAGVLLCGCGQSPEPVEMPEPSVEVVLVTEPPETETPTDATEVPTEASTEVTEATEHAVPEFQNHSGIRDNGTFDDSALFIGDFLTYGLITGYLTERELLGDARYMVIPNGALPAVYYGPKLTKSADCLFSPEFEGMLICDALKEAGEQTTAIYFMMGTNFSEFADDKTMIQIVEDMLINCPNATVYLQLVPFDRSTRVDYEEANRRILATYTYYQRENNPRVMLIDTQTAIGYNLTTDGIQLTTEGQACWYQALVAFADGNEIPQ